MIHELGKDVVEPLKRAYKQARSGGKTKTELKIRNMVGFLKRKVTKFGTSAKVDCPKEYLGKTVYLVVLANEK